MARGSKTHKTFCAAVRNRRLALGLTQAEVAKVLKISQPGYTAIETGRRVPSLDVVERVAKALKTSPANLVANPGETVIKAEKPAVA